LRALLSAVETRNVRPAGDANALSDVIKLTSDDRPASIARVAIRLAGAWRLRDAAARALQFASHQDGGKQDAGFAALRAMNGEEALKGLRDLTREQGSAAVRRKAAATLAAIDLPGSWNDISPVLLSSDKEADALALWRALLAGKDAPNQLAGLVPKNLPQPIAAAGLRAARETGRKGAPLVAALTPIAGAAPVAAAVQDYKELANLVRRDGNPAEGERIFRRVELACVTCHAIGGAGGKVGPELTSLGASAPLDYIIESTLSPAAKVKEGYHAVNLTLRDGTVSSGVLARETGTELILRNAIGQEIAVAKANVTGKEDIGSLMPAGLVEKLPQREQLHLFAFMAELGKPGVYDASKGNVIRAWKLSDVDPAQASSSSDQRTQPAFVPVLTNVDGSLARETLANALQLVSAPGPVTAFARFQHPAAGAARLTFTGVSQAWLNGKPLAIASEPNVTVDLPAGEHTLAVRLDPKQLPAILRVESSDVRFLVE
jgi:putative heme-binding domain-containing protein